MCPIFQNKEYDESICGDYTKALLEKLQRKPTKSRKLIATLKAEKILIKSTRGKWLIEHGCVVSNLYGVIEAKRGRVFKGFMEWVSDERRKGDKDSKYAIVSEGSKLIGNSGFGRTGMNKNKFKKVKYCTEVQFNRAKTIISITMLKNMMECMKELKDLKKFFKICLFKLRVVYMTIPS